MVNLINNIQGDAPEEDDPQDSYEVLEQSVDSQLPIEYYLFESSWEKFYYTSSEFPMLFMGKTWEPLQIERGIIRSGSSDSSNLALEIKMPTSCLFARKYGHIAVTPDIDLKLYRNFINILDQDAKIIWSGKVFSFAISGHITTLSVPNKASYYFNDAVPNVYYQTVCNHVLYDGRCGVSQSANTSTGKIKEANGINVSVEGMSPSIGDVKGGKITSVRTKESRLIMSNVGNDLKINYPMMSLKVGDECRVSRGCDHSQEMCKTRYNNIDNFGGHPSIPNENPFEGEIY